MKLLRWAMAGATVYVIYRYSIGKSVSGEDVFVSPDNALSNATEKPRMRKARALRG